MRAMFGVGPDFPSDWREPADAWAYPRLEAPATMSNAAEAQTSTSMDRFMASPLRNPTLKVNSFYPPNDRPVLQKVGSFWALSMGSIPMDSDYVSLNV